MKKGGYDLRYNLNYQKYENIYNQYNIFLTYFYI